MGRAASVQKKELMFGICLSERGKGEGDYIFVINMIMEVIFCDSYITSTYDSHGPSKRQK